MLIIFCQVSLRLRTMTRFIVEKLSNITVDIMKLFKPKSILEESSKECDQFSYFPRLVQACKSLKNFVFDLERSVDHLDVICVTVAIVGISIILLLVFKIGQRSRKVRFFHFETISFTHHHSLF